MGLKDKKLILARKTKKGNFSAQDILDVNDPFSSLEYGDVSEGEYQIWEYPTGVIYSLDVDRKVDDKFYYSTPYSKDGELWLPKLTEYTVDKERVENSYNTLLGR